MTRLSSSPIPLKSIISDSDNDYEAEIAADDLDELEEEDYE